MLLNRYACYQRPGILAIRHLMGWLIVFWLGGCTTNLNEAARPFDQQGDQTSRRVITIRFANLSEVDAVNVDFFVTYASLSVLPNDLFVPQNFYTNDIGVAGTGVLEPRVIDEIEIECTETMTIGTTGGRFLDNESGDHRGVGTSRWLQEGPLALCDGLVIFVYRNDESGFHTTVVVQN